MAEIIDISVDRSLTLEEYVAYAEEHVDINDDASIFESAWALRALANNRDFVLAGYHDQLKSYWSPQSVQVETPQSYMNARRENFYVRTNIWLPLAQKEDTRSERRLYAYDLAHDHNFDLLTVGYYGPGYDTDLFEYDYNQTQGYEGERVDMTLQGRFRLTPGRMILYRKGRDIHTQLPPESVSISLNLMCRPPPNRPTQQYIFDVNNGVLLKGAGCRSSVRLFMLDLLRTIHNENTIDVLETYVKRHNCIRTQAYALKVLEELRPEQGERFRSMASMQAISLSTLPLAKGHGVREIVA